MLLSFVCLYHCGHDFGSGIGCFVFDGWGFYCTDGQGGRIVGDGFPFLEEYALHESVDERGAKEYRYAQISDDTDNDADQCFAHAYKEHDCADEVYRLVAGTA